MSELELLKVFSKNLNCMMKEDNITQKDLANELGISQPIVSRYTSGQSLPSFITLIKMSEVFCCSLDDFLNT